MSIYYISFYNAESDNHGSFLSKQVLLWSFLSSLDNLFQICLGNGLVGSLNFSKYISKISVLINLEIFDNYMEQFRQPARPLKEPLYGQEEGELNE